MKSEELKKPSNKKGSLTIVGSGFQAVRHLTFESKMIIEQSDKVLYLVNDPVSELWIKKMNPNSESLKVLYLGGKCRADTYKEITELTLRYVREGLNVCVVYYGHPGVFVTPSHVYIYGYIYGRIPEGFNARMLPGISAEDCLFADLGIDPGTRGCQSFEATDFLLNRRKFDTRNDEAITFYDKALALDPNDTVSLHNKGNVLHNLDKNEEAIKYYNRVIALDPNYFDSYYNKGNALFSGRYNESISSFDKAIAIDPNSTNALTNKGVVLDTLGNFEEAITYYDKALAVDPNYTNALDNKGLALKNLGNYEEAIAYYDKELALDPNSTSALTNKGVALDNLGRYEEAIAYYDKALAVDPNDVDALNNKGVDLSILGRSEEAIMYYDKVLAIEPNDAVTLNNKGSALNDLGRYQEALQYFEKALDIDPKFELAANNKQIALDAINKQNTTATTELLPNNKTGSNT